MKRCVGLLFTLACTASLASMPVMARQPGATVTGQVTSDAGTPLASANVFIDGMGVGSITGSDGRYTFTVPASRVQATNIPPGEERMLMRVWWDAD